MSGGFAVLNPDGRDRDQEFGDAVGGPDSPGHPPVNYHGYAAAARGGFYRRFGSVPTGARDVLILLRRRNLRKVLADISLVRKNGGRAWISFKESGSHQVAALLADVAQLERFLEIAAVADGFLASTPEVVETYRLAGMTTGAFVPTPYPVGELGWDFGIPLAERAGIFVGTREFDVPSRRHAEAVMAADQLSRELECPLAVVNSDGRYGGMLLKRIKRKNPLFFIIEGPLEYPMYLKLMASHRVVFQLDRSCVPGQVAGDALLAGLPCVGGNGAIDGLAFPDLSGGSVAEAMGRAKALLTDDALHAATMSGALNRAKESLSFPAGAAALGRLFGRELFAA